MLARLTTAALSVAALAKITRFPSSRDLAGDNRIVREEILGSRAWASTVVVTGIFDERGLLEIEAIAVA